MSAIRLARKTDHAALAGLFIEYCRFYRLAHSRAQIARFVGERLRDRPLRTWVASNRRGADVPLAGFVQVYETVSTLSLARVWVLNDLYVHEWARSRGTGRGLIERVVTEARRSGAARVDLATQVGNRTARALYESMGFVRSKGFVGYSFVPKAPLPGTNPIPPRAVAP
jgi:ribosomal protein S18 acetylase RimI-like enzyme